MLLSELTKLLPGHDEEDGEGERAYRWGPDPWASGGACIALAMQESKWQLQHFAKSCRVSAFAGNSASKSRARQLHFFEAERDRSHHLYSNHSS